MTPTDPLAEALREGVRGRVTTSAAEVEPYSTDFSGVRRSVPRAVVVPAHEQDVIHALRMARSFGLPVAIRGAGHSANGRTVSDGGILLVNRADHAECEIQADGRVEVSARTPWRLLQIELARRGRAAPVLTDYLDLTVGGTLSVGGYGVRSIADGAQVEHVERLRLICPDGTAVWCSPREHADLFRSSLAGLGQAGVIERVVLRTIPYVRFTDLYACEHETTDALLDALRLATEAADPRPDHFLAYITAERITSQYGRSVTSLERALLGGPPRSLGRLAATFTRTVPNFWHVQHVQIARWHARFHRHRHLWVVVVLPVEAARSILPLCLGEIRSGPSSRYLPAVHILATRSPEDALRLPLAAHAGAGDLAVAIGLYYEVPASDAGGLRVARAAIERLLVRCLAIGGRPYRFGWNEPGESLDPARHAETGGRC